MFRYLDDLRAACLDTFMPKSFCIFIAPWYPPATSLDDRAMLGSNLSAITGNGDMGAAYSQIYAALSQSRSKSAVDRPWNRKFLGYTVTFHKPPRLKVAPASLTRFKGKLKQAFRRGKGRNLKKFIKEIKPILNGWINYFRLAEVKGIFEELHGWIRRRLTTSLFLAGCGLFKAEAQGRIVFEELNFEELKISTHDGTPYSIFEHFL